MSIMKPDLLVVLCGVIIWGGLNLTSLNGTEYKCTTRHCCYGHSSQFWHINHRIKGNEWFLTCRMIIFAVFFNSCDDTSATLSPKVNPGKPMVAKCKKTNKKTMVWWIHFKSKNFQGLSYFTQKYRWQQIKAHLSHSACVHNCSIHQPRTSIKMPDQLEGGRCFLGHTDLGCKGLGHQYKTRRCDSNEKRGKKLALVLAGHVVEH